MDPKKIGMNASIPLQTNVKGLRRYLVATTYHRRFIWMYAEITRQLYSLLKKEKKYEWTEECQRNFDEVKRILTIILIFVDRILLGFNYI